MNIAHDAHPPKSERAPRNGNYFMQMAAFFKLAQAAPGDKP